MKKYWVIGHPLSFCLTTPIMNRMFKEMGIDAQFETKDIKPDKFEDIVEKMKNGELAGAVMTRPFKTPSIDFLDKCDAEGQKIKAVNLVLPKEVSAGKKRELHGYNTDGIGALGAIHEKIKSLKGLHVHILGAGGAARAAAYSAKKEGAVLSIWNRTKQRAKEFADELGIEWVEDMRKWDGTPDVIINATSISSNSSQSTLVPFPLWQKVQLAMDAVYGKTSLFLEEAKAANVPHVLSGETWFIKQLEPQFELITGKKAPEDLITWLVHEAKMIRKV